MSSQPTTQSKRQTVLARFFAALSDVLDVAAESGGDEPSPTCKADEEKSDDREPSCIEPIFVRPFER